MRNNRSRIGLLAGLIVASLPAAASSDIESCPWGEPGCLLQGTPYLSSGNDSRDNLLRLLSEGKPIALPVQQPPADLTRSRDYYFDWHPQWDLPPAVTAGDGKSGDPLAAVPALAPQIAQLQLDPEPFTAVAGQQDERADRQVSNNLYSVSAFYAALLAEPTLTTEQRHQLALARLGIAQGVEAETGAELASLAQSFPANSAARQFADYLAAAVQFYLGDYTAAAADFATLAAGEQPWLAETAGYMQIRTALNQSSANSSGEYGDFDPDKIDQAAVSDALARAQGYLQKWPAGQYATAVNNLLRRIYWYQHEPQPLAQRYEAVLTAAQQGPALTQLILEYDNKLGSQYLEKPRVTAIPDAPLVTFIESLRAIRPGSDGKPVLTQQALESQKPLFEQAGKGAWWHWLQHELWFAQENYAAVTAAITPAKTLPASDILAFSEQVLYGKALMQQQQWPAARQHWLTLLSLSKEVEQQQYLQAQLAATLVFSNQADAVFAADSRVTNLRFRSQVLKTRASLATLRQQAEHGPNAEERTIALHTLLTRDLTEGHYGDWLQDKKRVAAITPPTIGEDFADVNLSVFDWPGSGAESGYYCQSLEQTVTTLSQKPADGHALNCLGEFFRTTGAKVDLWSDQPGNDVLNSATQRKDPPGQPDRQRYYQQIVADPKAEAEDKSYALYRAVMCYAPSGYNDCGGAEVDKRVRKGWFNQLKAEYGRSPWAEKLKYYW